MLDATHLVQVGHAPLTVLRHHPPRAVPGSGLGRRSSVSGRPLKGWRVASKGLGPLPRRRGSALAHGCDRGGRVVLPLARAAAVSTGLRVQPLAHAQRVPGEG
jgi:hypothetical protein